jgi:hypothetical protein
MLPQLAAPGEREPAGGSLQRIGVVECGGMLLMLNLVY